MSDKLQDQLAQAELIVAELRHMRASQCQNCGMAYYNGYETHEPRGLLRRPQCVYAPTGWQAVADAPRTEEERT